MVRGPVSGAGTCPRGSLMGGQLPSPMVHHLLGPGLKSAAGAAIDFPAKPDLGLGLSAETDGLSWQRNTQLITQENAAPQTHRHAGRRPAHPRAARDRSSQDQNSEGSSPGGVADVCREILLFSQSGLHCDPDPFSRVAPALQCTVCPRLCQQQSDSDGGDGAVLPAEGFRRGHRRSAW